jgi:hypothetical protein
LELKKKNCNDLSVFNICYSNNKKDNINHDDNNDENDNGNDNDYHDNNIHDNDNNNSNERSIITFTYALGVGIRHLYILTFYH